MTPTQRTSSSSQSQLWQDRTVSKRSVAPPLDQRGAEEKIKRSELMELKINSTPRRRDIVDLKSALNAFYYLPPAEIPRAFIGVFGMDVEPIPERDLYKVTLKIGDIDVFLAAAAKISIGGYKLVSNERPAAFYKSLKAAGFEQTSEYPDEHTVEIKLNSAGQIDFTSLPLAAAALKTSPASYSNPFENQRNQLRVKALEEETEALKAQVRVLQERDHERANELSQLKQLTQVLSQNLKANEMIIEKLDEYFKEHEGRIRDPGLEKSAKQQKTCEDDQLEVSDDYLDLLWTDPEDESEGTAHRGPS